MKDLLPVFKKKKNKQTLTFPSQLDQHRMPACKSHSNTGLKSQSMIEKNGILDRLKNILCFTASTFNSVT